jgi:hypothetical protein
VSVAELLARCPSGAFPHLAGDDFEKTSDEDLYNCIAWAADDTANWWWPDDHWPAGAPREETLRAFVAAYGTLGYEPCDHGDFEFAWERVVIYCDPTGTPTHAARQRDDGAWTSKLGAFWDIRHATPRGVEGPLYGSAVQFLRRPLAHNRWVPRFRCRARLCFSRVRERLARSGEPHEAIIAGAR